MLQFLKISWTEEKCDNEERRERLKWEIKDLKITKELRNEGSEDKKDPIIILTISSTLILLKNEEQQTDIWPVGEDDMVT